MANYVTIIDNYGRNILGTVANETQTELHIANPVMIAVQPQNQQFQVQLIPLFLAEFITPGQDGTRNYVFAYNKANIAVGLNFNIDGRILGQYDKILEATNKPKEQKASPEVIKLFDE